MGESVGANVGIYVGDNVGAVLGGALGINIEYNKLLQISKGTSWFVIGLNAALLELVFKM